MRTHRCPKLINYYETSILFRILKVDFCGKVNDGCCQNVICIVFTSFYNFTDAERIVPGWVTDHKLPCSGKTDRQPHNSH